MGSDLCRDFLTKESKQSEHKNRKILTHFDLWKCSENRQSEKSLKNIWRKFEALLFVLIFHTFKFIFTFAESENGNKANNVRVPYYAKEKRGGVCTLRTGCLTQIFLGFSKSFLPDI